MKKSLILTIIGSLLLASIAFFSFADNEEVPKWYGEMIEWRIEQIDKAVEDGIITKEQGELQKEHMLEMEEFHNENYNSGYQNRFGHGMMNRGFGGFRGFGGGFGHCH